MSISKTNKILRFIGYRMRATVSDTRSIVGKLLAFDRHMNLVLGDAEEFRIVKSKQPGDGAGVAAAAEREEKRTLGLVLLRGECVVSLSVVSRPAQNESRAKTAAHTPGVGVGRAAGRGIVQAPAGLGAMPPGMGAPPPGFMNPGLMMPGLPGMPPGMGLPGLPGMPPGMPMMPPLGMPMPPGFGRGFNPMSGMPPGFPPQ